MCSFTKEEEKVKMMFEADKQELEKCPFCGGTLVKGMIESLNAGSLLNTTAVVNFVPEEEKGKFIRKNAVSLRLKADGYSCEECMRFFGVYEQRY